MSEWMSTWVNDHRSSAASNRAEHGYLADDQRALFGRGQGWFTLHVVMDNHGFHGLCFTVAQVQR